MIDIYEHWSGLLTSKDIGLGWLKTITMLKTQSAMSSHRHAHSTAEIIFCLKGKFHYSINGVGERTIGSGDFIVIPARTEHMLKNNIEIPGERLSFFIRREMEPNPRFAVFSAADYRGLRTHVLRTVGKPFKMPTSLLDNVRRISTIIGCPPDAISSREFALLRILACTILYDTVAILERPPVRPKPSVITAAIQFLEEHYTEKLRIGDLLRHVGYGRARFFDLFRERTHLTPIEYLTRYRIAKANELLLSTNLAVNQVAARVGIENPAYFAALFKRHMGKTPQAMRLQAHHTAGTVHQNQIHRLRGDSTRPKSFSVSQNREAPGH